MILSLFLQGYNQRSAYIASQGESFPNNIYIITIYYVMRCIFFHPNGLGPNPVTISDFIQMVWDQRPPVLVMLTHLVEKGKVLYSHIHVLGPCCS